MEMIYSTPKTKNFLSLSEHLSAKKLDNPLLIKRKLFAPLKRTNIGQVTKRILR